jgi:hypothetical protein
MQAKRSSRRIGVKPGPRVPAHFLGLLFLIPSLVVVSAAPASAAQTHPLKTTFGALSRPSGIAIDEANGNLFVADGGASNMIEIFGFEGGAPSGVSATHIAGFAFDNEPSGLAIDNSESGPSKGTLYVADVRAPPEVPGGQQGALEEFSLNVVSEEYEPAGKLDASPDLSEPLGASVNADGDIFVADFGSSSVVEFNPTGTEELTRIDVGATVGRPSSLAFDAAGDLFVQSFVGLGVWKLEANLAGEIEPSTTPVQVVVGSSTGIAINQASGSLYVAQRGHVDQYSTSCTPVEGQCERELQFGIGRIGNGQNNRVAVNSKTGLIYVTDTEKGRVAVFSPQVVIVPDVKTAPASAVKLSAATLNGAIDPAGGPAASCQFEYTTEKEFKAKGFETATTVPCPGGPFAAQGETPVQVQVGGLAAETTYVFRLMGENENGPEFSDPLSFTTIGKPKIEASTIAAIQTDSARVNGRVNPHGGPGAAVQTTYAVEYVSQADFDLNNNEYDQATSVPVPLSSGGQGIGSGNAGVAVTQPLSGLAEGTTYHFRIVAENEAGTEIGPDKVFTTFKAEPGGLPDGRVYEQVTPVDKNGGAPELHGDQAALDGNGITFTSNAGIPGGEGAQEFPEYLAARGTAWSTQGLLPPASLGSAAKLLGWSEDLSRAYVMQAKLPKDPPTLFERNSATRALRPISVEGKELSTFTYVATSADSSVALFESDMALPGVGGAVGTGVFNTYAWDSTSGELSLVGVFNKNNEIPAKGSSIGANNPKAHNTYNQARHAISTDGSRVFFTDAKTGQLYLRLNPTRPQSPLAGKTCTEPELLACTVQVSASQRATAPLKDEKPATFWAATPDGSRAFFTSPGTLTDNATTGPGDEGSDLYRYDAPSTQLIDLTPDVTDPKGADVQGVLGVSDDGSRVYFAANGVLAVGAAPGKCTGATAVAGGSGTCNLYLWHDGTIVFIAPIKLSSSYENADSANWLPESTVENTARVSADGQTLLFRSQLQLTDYENEGTPEFYLYRGSGTNLDCVSCSTNGAPPVGSPSLSGNAVVDSRPILSRNLSSDGGRVFFQSPDKLLAADTNGDAGCPSVFKTGAGESQVSKLRFCQDVYEWEAEGVGTCQSASQNGGCLYLISTGASPEPSLFADADQTGDNAFLFTAQGLVGQDTDQITDIYDARVGGGIPSQNPPPLPPPCLSGEACLGAPPPAPESGSAGTAGFAGPGNQQDCPKGKVRKGGKCVKKGKSHKKQKQKRRRAAGKQG